MDKNLKRLARLQDVLDVYDRQLKNLQDLAEQINEDNKSIHFYIEHEDEINRQQQHQHPFYDFFGGETWKQGGSKPPEFEAFYMQMRDHYAMHFIGIITTGLKEQQEMIKDKIKHLKEKIINEN